jgi:hypothetical protein
MVHFTSSRDPAIFANREGLAPGKPSARGRAGARHRRRHRGLLTVEDTLAALEMARSAKYKPPDS